MDWVGPSDAPEGERIDLGAALVTPGLVDSHTHPVYAGDRSDEAAARLAGAPYTDGGILRTVRATRQADDATLERLVEMRLRAALAAGTTTVECKSGYGLSLDEELRHLRIIGRVADRLPIRVVRTFLGAHAVPPEAASMAAYADEVAEVMIPAVAHERLAEFVDVFADRGFFDLEATERIGRAASAAGLALRLHADQLQRTGAAELGVRLGAASVDHLEQLDADGVGALAASDTVATLLPAPAVVLRDHLPPARALSTLVQPLPSPATPTRAPSAASERCRSSSAWAPPLLGMTVTEALTAATSGGASALRRDDIGTLGAASNT